VADVQLTTTSYAILSLLALREYSAYELIQRMERSLQFYWPRAQSKLYEEPKKLVAAGFARSREEPAGRRTRTVYKITPAGRRALRRWLTLPGAGPVLEFEALLKTAFADHGTLSGLRANLEAVQAEARQVRAFGRMLRDDFLAGAPTFTDRLHIAVLVWHFLYDWARQREAWADFALEWINGWDDTSPTPDRLAAARSWFEQALADDNPESGLAESSRQQQGVVLR
jgi:PadR family transcriptional regulator AphA